MESGPYTLEIAKRWIRGVMELRGGLDMLQKAIMDLRVIVYKKKGSEIDRNGQNSTSPMFLRVRSETFSKNNLLISSTSYSTFLFFPNKKFLPHFQIQI